MKSNILALLTFTAILVICSACASEKSNRAHRTINQLLTPDKLNMQIHVNPDIRNDNRDDTEIQQVRMGLDWDL